MLPPPKSDGRLEKVLRAGLFAVTAELNPPDSADPHDVFDAALVLSQVCDAINATDAAGAHCHMSSVAICALLTHAGYSPVMQVSCRDRNRIAIQGDVLGAAAITDLNAALGGFFSIGAKLGGASTTAMFGGSSRTGTQDLVLAVPEPGTAALLLAARAPLAAGLHHKSGQRLPAR